MELEVRLLVAPRARAGRLRLIQQPTRLGVFTRQDPVFPNHPVEMTSSRKS